MGANVQGNVHFNDQKRHQSLRLHALELHRSGRLDEAAAGYETVLTSWPDDAGVHGNLAGIRLMQERWIEAIWHIHQACELGKWSDPVVGRNFAHIIRLVLQNLDRRRQASQWRSYLDRSRDAKGIPLTVSVLVPDSAPDLERQLGELASQQLLPAEVLVGADAGPVPAGLPFQVRKTALPATANNHYVRINALAQQAAGHWLLVLRAGDTMAPDHLSSLTQSMASLEAWGYCSNSIEFEPFVTAGYEVLRGDAFTAGAAGLLVAKTLHDRIGGYAPDSSDPGAEYCLRLLWEAEPAKIHIAKSRLATRVTQAKQLRILVAGYLDKILSEPASPNSFLPCARNWGLSFYKFVMDQGWMLSQQTIRRMVADLTSYLIAAESQEIRLKPGVNLVGSALGEFGLGENMRAIAHAAEAGDIPNCVIDVNFAKARQGDITLLDRIGADADHRCSVFFFNPDASHLYRQSLDSLVFGRSSAGFPHYRIGYWAWELEKFLPEWRYALDRVDEIWTVSGFAAKAISAVTDKPVIKIPPPIAFTLPGGFDRASFGLPVDRFVFLYSFNFASYPARKNPEAAIRAFKRAFPDPHTPVSLLLKSTHGADWPKALESLRKCIGDDSRIILMDRYLNREEVFGLQSVCDAYVSLHRSEGLGLGMAESMYLGKPVIGTGYSGNLEFMTEDNSGLVRHTMTPVRPGEYYLCNTTGYFWAEPDIGHAAELMLRVFEDRDFRERIGMRGRQDILSNHNHAVAAAAMRSRLVEIGAL